MTHGSVGASVAISAAAAAKRQQDMEEEEMTTYTPEDLDQEWEFKIVRSTFESFRKLDKLQEVIETEARAGWVMVEKFDNARIRFKRPISARAQDAMLPPEIDPYRTSVGTATPVILMILLGLTVFLVLGTIFLVL